MSRRELSLTMKAVVSREVRENSKVASTTVAGRLGGRSVQERNRVGRAHGEEKLRVARLRAAKPGAVYGDAVKKANMRGSKNKGKQRTNSFDHLR